MVFAYLSAALQKLRPFKAPMLVVAVSALLALLFTIATKPPASDPPHPAGEAAMRLMDAEHELVTASVRAVLAAASTQPAASEPSRVDTGDLAVTGTLRPMGTHRPSIVAANPVKAIHTASSAPKPAPMIEPPLQLQAFAAVRAERRAPVMEQTRAVLAAVGQIPQWLRLGAENVADWAATASAKTISRLPEHRFL